MKKFEDFYKMTLVHLGTVSQKTGLKSKIFMIKLFHVDPTSVVFFSHKHPGLPLMTGFSAAVEFMARGPCKVYFRH